MPRNHVSQDLAQNAILFALKTCSKWKTQNLCDQHVSKVHRKAFVRAMVRDREEQDSILKKSSKIIEKYRNIDTSGCVNPG